MVRIFLSKLILKSSFFHYRNCQFYVKILVCFFTFTGWQGVPEICEIFVVPIKKHRFAKKSSKKISKSGTFGFLFNMSFCIFWVKHLIILIYYTKTSQKKMPLKKKRQNFLNYLIISGKMTCFKK